MLTNAHLLSSISSSNGSKLSEDMSKLYQLTRWPEDPRSEEGRKRYVEALDRFRSLLSHEWFSEILNRGKVRLVDICGGTGIGGVALSKVLLEAGAEVELTVVDLRVEALEKAKLLSAEELGVEAITDLMDVRELHSLHRKFDLALLYGYSTPHFDPWEMAKLLASVSRSLDDRGLMVVEEQDRQYLIFYRREHRDWLVEDIGPERLLVSVHWGYDHLRGSFKRAILDLFTKEGPIALEVYFWNLAGLMAMSWLFFEDIDFLPYKRGTFNGLILAKGPRRKLEPEDIRKPRVLREK